MLRIQGFTLAIALSRQDSLDEVHEAVMRCQSVKSVKFTRESGQMQPQHDDHDSNRSMHSLARLGVCGVRGLSRGSGRPTWDPILCLFSLP